MNELFGHPGPFEHLHLIDVTRTRTRDATTITSISVIPSASPENEFDGRQKTDLLAPTSIMISSSLRDMAKSAWTVRDDSHERAFIEYEERMAAIQASAQAVSRSSIAHRYTVYLSLDQPPFPTSDFQHSLSHAGDKRTKRELEGFENNAGMAGSSVRAAEGGGACISLAEKWAEVKGRIPNHVSCCFLSINPGSAPLRHRLSI
jgi:hypothetical protein